MNDIFSSKRFGKYFLYDLRSFISRYWVALVILALMPVIIFLERLLFAGVLGWHGGNLSPSGEGRVAVFMFCCVMLCISVPYVCYGRLTDKAEGTSWLLLPASTLEKYLSMVLVCMVVAPLVYIAVYICADALVCLATGDRSIASQALHMRSEDIYPGAGGLWLLWANLAIASAFFLLGSIFFERNKILKSLLVLFALFILLSIFGVVAIGRSFEGSEEDIAFRMAEFFGKDNAEFKINMFLNLLFGVEAAVLLSLLWLRIKNLRH